MTTQMTEEQQSSSPANIAGSQPQYGRDQGTQEEVALDRRNRQRCDSGLVHETQSPLVDEESGDVRR